MTTIKMSHEASFYKGVTGTPGLMGQIKSYLARSRAERQLRLLDDRLLADIGLKRHEIGQSIWGV